MIACRGLQGKAGPASQSKQDRTGERPMWKSRHHPASLVCSRCPDGSVAADLPVTASAYFMLATFRSPTQHAHRTCVFLMLTGVT